MHVTKPTLLSQVLRTTVAVACFAGWTAQGQPANAQTLLYDMEGGTDSTSRNDDGRLVLNTSQRSPQPTIGMEGDTLVINGVAGAHDVYIIGVEGNPGAMTVQFDDVPIKFFDDVENIEVNFVGGPNFLALLQVAVGGNVAVTAGDGDNTFFLGYHTYDPNVIGGDLTFLCGHGANEILFEESWVFGHSDFVMGDGGNYLLAGLAGSPSDLGVVIGGQLFVGTGNGNDKIEITKSWLGGDTLIETADGHDIVLLGTHYYTGSPVAGNVCGGDLDVITGFGDDAVGLTDNEVYGDVDIALENDDDVLLIGAGAFPGNDFFDHFTADGGDGVDDLDESGNSYAHSPHFKNFEAP